MSKQQYQIAKDRIATEFKSARATCGSLPSDARELCRAEASRQNVIAAAALEANYGFSPDGSYKARIAVADADYLVARRKCDDKAGNAKNLCLKEARAVQVAAKAQAKVVDEYSSDGRAASHDAAARKASREEEERTEARKDAATEKRSTEYAIAKERCALLANDPKIACRKESKTNFGQL